MQLQSQRADGLNQLEFDEMVDVFGQRILADQCLTRFGFVIGGDGIECFAQLRCFIFC